MERTDPFVRTLESFAEEWAARSRADFLASHEAPFLLQLTGPGDSDPSAATDSGGSAFGTMATPVSAALGEPSRRRLFELRKRSRNPFSDMITVGRALNNDIVIASGCISKFHAFFRATPRGWAIVDAGSTNGTRLDGEPLAPTRVHVIAPSRLPVPIDLGAVKCLLLGPEHLWDEIRGRYAGTRAVG